MARRKSQLLGSKLFECGHAGYVPGKQHPIQDLALEDLRSMPEPP